MRAVVQRVRDAQVTVGGEVVGAIGHGLLVYLGVSHDDAQEDVDYVAGKVVNLRIFPDTDGKMNLSLLDLRTSGAERKERDSPGLLVISQFTLYGDVRKGRRPSYNDAASPDHAVATYERFLRAASELGVPPQQGVFQEHMDVRYTNDGPVTIIIDSKKKR